jgi:hypothetical protein
MYERLAGRTIPILECSSVVDSTEPDNSRFAFKSPWSAEHNSGAIPWRERLRRHGIATMIAVAACLTRAEVIVDAIAIDENNLALEWTRRVAGECNQKAREQSKISMWLRACPVAVGSSPLSSVLNN